MLLRLNTTYSQLAQREKEEEAWPWRSTTARGSSANGRPRLGGGGGSAYANLSPNLREYTALYFGPPYLGPG